MRGKRVAVPLALAVVSMGLAAAPASAVVSTIYVEGGGPGRTCSDTGVGSSSLPFCTISKAASVVQPGQTVMIGGGSYPETVTITAKGTAAAPIRFVGQSNFGDANSNPLATWVGSDGATDSGNHAFVLNGAQYVTITGMALSANQEAVLVQNSQHVTVDSIQTTNQHGSVADVRVSGSSNVTLSRSMLEYGAQLDSGDSGTVIDSDLIVGSPLDGVGGVFPAVRATDATGTVVESDTIAPGICATGVDLEGASSGSVIANNIVDTAGTGLDSCNGLTGVVVAPTATSGTTSDYNVVYTNGAAPYSWNGTNYADLASFTAATSQGAHDVSADPKLVLPSTNGFSLISTPYYPSEGSPVIDSGDAAHAPTTDANGMARVDDPLAANTGTGSGYVDRGAYEYQDPIAMVPITVKHVAGGSPLDTAITAGVSAAWSNQITYTYDFRDGSSATVTGGLSATEPHDFASAGYTFVGVSATDGFATTSPNDQNSYSSFMLGADYTPMNPTRMLDTRKAIGVGTTTPVPANSDVTLDVGGVNGIPTTGLSAVVMNVTVTKPTAGGFLTVYPHGAATPNSSNLNFGAGQTVPNLVTTMVTDGKVNFHNGSAGTVHIVADVEGYYADSGYGFKSVTPVRVLDTRKPTGVPVKAPVPANGHLALDLSSQVPAGTKAVTMNVTVTNPKAGGYLTVYPDGSPAPLASNLNFSAGQTVPNLVTVPVNNGKVDFQNTSGGTVDVVADLAGYYGDATTGATAGLAPNLPFRIWDTRFYGPPSGPVTAGGTLHLTMNDFSSGDTPPKPIGAVMNVTVTGPVAGGYLTVYPDGASRPTASNVNFSPHQTVPNLVTVALGADGADIYNGSAGNVNIVVDLEGVFVPPLS